MMLEIAIILMMLCVLMARRGKGRRRMGKYIRGHIEESLSLGALAAVTMIKNFFDDIVNERTYVSSIVATWSLADYVAASNVGPVVVGVAHGDYDLAEIEAWMESSGSWNEGNLISQEVARRKCRVVGVFEGSDVAKPVVTLNDGRPLKTKLGWILNQGQTLNLWAYNAGSVALTADPELNLFGHANLWPR